jgi:4-hydroxy-3-polyprenylbenzoate decarboxylase
MLKVAREATIAGIRELLIFVNNSCLYRVRASSEPGPGCHVVPSSSRFSFSFILSAYIVSLAFNNKSMPYSGLSGFIACLEKEGEIQRIRSFVDPVLEIAEVADRVIKSGGKALLFENTSTRFPLLINIFGSGRRISLALGRDNPATAGNEIMSLLDKYLVPTRGFVKKLPALHEFFRMSTFLPSRVKGRGICQQVIHDNPDLGIFPVLKCWPFDGGRFITLPVVHTVHPETGRTNAGMYRMQVIDRSTTAMHWQRHKTGAVHFEAWKRTGKRMPVAVSLGGDPVYTYSATAPLPENIDEYILAGFLRGRKVKLVKCITNDLYVPADSDIVIEGYVDPFENPVIEGPFGDHTGFYSLADYYPLFHVTCITHYSKAVYPATIVGVPPMEDAWLTRATEKIFLAPVKLALQPEVEDFHMPDAGVAHNLAVVKINKSYPGQGKKVISAFSGAGQLMFTKFIVVTSGEINIRDYGELILHVIKNTCFSSDLLFSSGPLDVLDHSSDYYSMGSKLGIDGTIKLDEELPERSFSSLDVSIHDKKDKETRAGIPGAMAYIRRLDGLPVIITGINHQDGPGAVSKARNWFLEHGSLAGSSLVVAVDRAVDPGNLLAVAWQVLGNSDPRRDIEFLPGNSLFIDATAKVYREGGFARKWPNVVCSSPATIESVDQKWESLGIGPFIPSPSLKNSCLLLKGDAEAIIPGE